MSNDLTLVDASGKPLVSTPAADTASAAPANTRARALNRSGQFGAQAFPYDAANWITREMGDWLPILRSPDSEINQFRDRIVARSRDLARNDGWASGGVMRILDNTVGSGLRLSAHPDWRALKRYGTGFDAAWANEFRQAVEALWREYSTDLGKYNDVTRAQSVGGQQRLAMRHKLIDGESLLASYWLPERVGRGAAKYATSFLLVDPDRLSNPYQIMDTEFMRGGCELDDYGATVAYHVRKAHQNDYYNATKAWVWERIEREDPDGWQRMFHDFESDRAGQHRGVSMFTVILGHMKMLAHYYGVELQAAAIAATFGTYVKSPYDPAQVQDALGAGDEELSRYQALRADWHEERPIMLNGASVPTLAPGEDIISVAAGHPHSNFGTFVGEMLGMFSSASGISREQVTGDYSKVNYSSARAALLEVWKTLTRRVDEFKRNTATPQYACWLREPMEKGMLDDVLPRNAPDFVEAMTAYSSCSWLGVARGWVDPVKEPQGSQLKMQNNLSNLQRECAEQGLDWEEVLHQRAVEQKLMQELGLPQPAVLGAAPGDEPDQSEKPE